MFTSKQNCWFVLVVYFWNDIKYLSCFVSHWLCNQTLSDELCLKKVTLWNSLLNTNAFNMLTLLTDIIDSRNKFLFEILAVFGNLFSLLQEVLSSLLNWDCQNMSFLGAALFLTGWAFVACVYQSSHLGSTEEGEKKRSHTQTGWGGLQYCTQSVFLQHWSRASCISARVLAALKALLTLSFAARCHQPHSLYMWNGALLGGAARLRRLSQGEVTSN